MFDLTALTAAVETATHSFTGCDWDLTQPGYDYTADDVAASAREAADAGRRALAFAADGEWEQAEGEARRAFAAEDQYGDAPAWGPVLRMFEAAAQAAVDAAND